MSPDSDRVPPQAQQQQQQPLPPSAGYPSFPFANPTAQPTAPPPQSELERAYPALFDMGLNLTPEEIAMITDGHVAVRPPQPPAAAAAARGQLVAPVSGQSLGLARAQVTHGIREVTLCKEPKSGKCGFRVQAINKVSV